MQKLINKTKELLKNIKNGDPKPTKVKKVNKNDIQEYYDQASGWAYDSFDALVVSRDRWKLFGIVSMVFIFMLMFIIILMFPLKQTIPFVVHKDSNGVVWVEAPNGNMTGKNITPSNKAQIRQDLYQFVEAFESYDPYTTLKIGKKYVENMANTTVFNQFEEQLSDPQGYFTRLGAKGSRKIVVESVSLLQLSSKLDPNSTAMVRFRSEEHNNSGIVSNVKQWQATVVWKYNGTPSNLIQQFINYNGFQVISYNVVPFDQGEKND